MSSSIIVIERCKSLSARRAWIEIVPHGLQVLLASVALRKESVDRNLEFFQTTTLNRYGRSPQGERG